MRSCKFLKSYLLIPLYFFVAPAFGQQPSFYGSKNPYHYSGHDTIQPPAGYHAFFINYAGRHGARHLTNLKEISLLDEFMTYAGDSGGLTGEGRKLQHMIHILLEVEKKYTPGTLSMLGSEEQSGLGKRMAKRYPMIISNANSCITIVSTKEKRTVQSAESFMNGLLSGYKDKYRCIHKMPADSIHLRFFSLSPAYKDFLKNGNWKDKAKELDTAATSKMVNKDIIERFFSTAFINKQQS
ncbi:MAG TPA: histidine-type phosphatase [Chitinophagaceae bacterium]|nr:histidine-type phosphatase [Chitinophagaceae bacterium]